MKNILWLTEWWPNELEPLAGDFIERYSKAASLYNNVVVIFVKKNPALPLGKVKLEEKIYNNNLRAWVYYYPSIGRFSRMLDVIYSNYWFIRLHRKGLRTFKKKYGKPFGVQVNVSMKVGIIALMWRWFRNMRYIIVEGWTLFLPEAKPALRHKSRFFRFMTRVVLKNASLLVTVSKHLGEMITQNVAKIPYRVIPRAFDSTIFYPSQLISMHEKFRFIHISTLDYAKNIKEILLALKEVLKKNYQVELIVHAPPNKELNQLLQELQLEKNVILKGEVPQNELAESIRSSDALILFSLYETFGNVVIEAQACGLPVIASDYPVFNETIEDKKNGIIAKGKSSKALCDAMIELLNNKDKFDRNEISASVLQRYSFERIGKKLDDVYQQYF
jgi:glycosyltransferase involved in cell wall biosynthesis